MRWEIDHLNKAISMKGFNLIINDPPKRAAEGPDGFIAESCQPFKKEMMPFSAVSS